MSTAQQHTAQQQELDALASLEERIRGAVELVSSLRSQNQDLQHS